MTTSPELDRMISEVTNDLLSGAAELALRAVNIFRYAISDECGGDRSLAGIRSNLTIISKKLIKGHPAMAPIFNLCNQILFTAETSSTTEELEAVVAKSLDEFETRLCNSASKIAETAIQLIPYGELVFAYSFSSTVISALLNARSNLRSFRVICTESRPSMEGRKMASVLASSGIEVVHSFDSAMGLYLPTCRVAFMGVDAIARPGIVNKVGSWLLALACRELNIPLYALTGTEKFITDDQLFNFEDFERPGSEIWPDPPKGVTVLNRQFELIPFNWIAGVVTEDGILRGEADVEKYVDAISVHAELEDYAMSN